MCRCVGWSIEIRLEHLVPVNVEGKQASKLNNTGETELGRWKSMRPRVVGYRFKYEIKGITITMFENRR